MLSTLPHLHKIKFLLAEVGKVFVLELYHKRVVHKGSGKCGSLSINQPTQTAEQFYLRDTLSPVHHQSVHFTLVDVQINN